MKKLVFIFVVLLLAGSIWLGSGCGEDEAIDDCVSCLRSANGMKCCLDNNKNFKECVRSDEICPCNEIQTRCTHLANPSEYDSGQIEECCDYGCCGSGTSQGCKLKDLACCPSTSFSTQCPTITQCCGDDLNGWTCCGEGDRCLNNVIYGGKACCKGDAIVGVGTGCCIVKEYQCGELGCCPPELCTNNGANSICCEKNQTSCGDKCCDTAQRCCEFKDVQSGDIDSQCKEEGSNCCGSRETECLAVGNTNKVVACASEAEICCNGGKYSASIYECCDGVNGVELCKTKGTVPTQKCENNICVNI